MISREELHALADNELSAEDRAAALAQVQADPSLESEYRSILNLKDSVRAHCEAPESGELWKECRERLEEIDNTKRVERFVGKYAWGICGVFFLAIAVGGMLTRSAAKQVMPSDVAGYVASMSPVPVSKSESQAALDPVLKQVVGETFKNRPASMYVTAIGRNTRAGERATFVQLSDEFGAIALVALYDVTRVAGLWDYEADPNFKCGDFDGVNALFWQRPDGVICMATGQRSYAELHSVVKTMGSYGVSQD